MSSVSNNISKSNDNFISFLENPVVKYCVLIFITLLIISIEKIETSFLEVFDLDIFKVVYALFIAYTACFDPIYAIILTTFMIISIQELHTRKSHHAISSNTIQNILSNKVQPAFIGSKITDNKQSNSNLTNSNQLNSNQLNSNQLKQTIKYNTMPSNDILLNNKIVYDMINKQSLQKNPEKNDTLISEYDAYVDPAFNTLTNNLNNNNYMNKNQFFISDEDLINAQTNVQPNVNQNTSVKALGEMTLNIQGLPYGYDPKSLVMNNLDE